MIIMIVVHDNICNIIPAKQIKFNMKKINSFLYCAHTQFQWQ